MREEDKLWLPRNRDLTVAQPLPFVLCRRPQGVKAGKVIKDVRRLACELAADDAVDAAASPTTDSTEGTTTEQTSLSTPTHRLQSIAADDSAWKHTDEAWVRLRELCVASRRCDVASCRSSRRTVLKLDEPSRHIVPCLSAFLPRHVTCATPCHVAGTPKSAGERPQS